MALSGTVKTSSYSTGNGSMYYVFSWSATQNISANKSTVSWTLKTAGSMTGYIAERTVNLRINGSTKWSKTDRVERYTGQTVASGSFSVTHNSSGAGSFTVYIEGALYSSSITVTSSTTTCTLNTIARASSISSVSSSVTLGNAPTVKWTPKSTSFKFKLEFKCGSYPSHTTGFISPKTTSSYSYHGYTMTLETWGAAIPNASSGTCTVTLSSYTSDGKLIGTSSKTFTIKIPNNSTTKPTLTSVPVTNSSSPPLSSYNVYVLGKSYITFGGDTTSATSKYGSTIKSIVLKIGSVSITTTGSSSSMKYSKRLLVSTSNGFSVSSSLSATLTITDSRGFTSSQTVSIGHPVITYTAPYISGINSYRCNSSGTEDDEGTYAHIAGTAKLDTGIPSNTATIKLTINGSTTTKTTTSASTTIQSLFGNAIGGGNLSVDVRYLFTITIADNITTTAISYSGTIRELFAIIDIYKDGTGLMIGGAATTSNLFEVGIASKFNESITIGDSTHNDRRINFKDSANRALWMGYANHDNPNIGEGHFYLYDSTNQRAIISASPTKTTFYGDLSGGTVNVTGDVTSAGVFKSTRSDGGFSQTHGTSGNKITFGIGSGGTNRGIYDDTLKNWMIRRGDGTNGEIYFGGGLRPGTTASYALGDTTHIWSNLYTEAIRLYRNTSYYFGFGGTPTANRTITFQNASGTVAFTSSDARLKENVKDTVKNGLDVINQLKVRQFDWRANDEVGYNKGTHQDIGFVADELEKIDPRFVVNGSGGYNDDGTINPKCIDTFYLVGYLTKAVQELSEEINKIKESEGLK